MQFITLCNHAKHHLFFISWPYSYFVQTFFPEIPLFHILNACITFGNLYAKQEPVEGVTNVVVEDLDNPDPVPVAEAKEADPDRDVDATVEPPMMVCSVDPSVFEVPEGYGLYQSQSREVRYGEDELLQLAIQQSLMEGSSDPDQVRRKIVLQVKDIEILVKEMIHCFGFHKENRKNPKLFQTNPVSFLCD